MSVWTKRIALYIDVDSAGAPPLLDGASSARRSAKPSFVQGDKVRLELRFRSIADSPLSDSSAVQMPEGATIAVAGKAATAMDEAEMLFAATGFTEVVDDEDVYYYADIDLNTQEMDDLFSDLAASYADIKVDVEVRNSDNTDRLTFQFDATARHQVYSGAPAPEPGTPPYYSAAEAEARFVPRREDEAFMRWANGRWYHYISDTGLWYPEVAKIVDGVPIIALGEGVEL